MPIVLTSHYLIIFAAPFAALKPRSPDILQPFQWCENGRTQKNIAEQAFMTESVLSQVIKAMEQSGVLIRKADPKDARIKRVFLTDKGRSLREKIVLKGIGLSRAHAPELSLEEVKTTIDVLIKVTQDLPR